MTILVSTSTTEVKCAKCKKVYEADVVDHIDLSEDRGMIKSLKAEGKKFEYEIFEEVPGGHSFDRMDTKIAKEIRVKIYKFLDKELNPPVKIKSVHDIMKASYLK